MFHQMKLGRQPAELHRALPLLRDVAKLPAAWPSADWSRSVAAYRMSMNDQFGTCTIAAMANYRWQAGIYAPLAYGMTDDEVAAIYRQINPGWDATNPATDHGAVEVALLDLWKGGITIGGKLDQIEGYAAIPVADIEHVKVAIDMLGGAMVGCSMPISAQSGGPIWDVVKGPDGVRGGWGGHEMLANGYDSSGIQFVTWREKQHATWGWFAEYVDEVQAVLSRDWLTARAINPAGFDWDAIRAVI